MVREQQTMFRLPDLSQMQVKVTVHESKVDSLREGMRARIRVQDHEFQGTVDSVANQPEPSSWFSASVKEYATSVKIDGQPQHLRPGMTAEVEILVAQLKSVLTLPVAAVVEQRGKLYCWVRRGNRIERRPLVLGLNNDKFVEVKDGVAAGDEVLLNPRALVAEARAEEPGAEPVDVGKKFGTPAEGKGPASPKGAGQRPAGTPAGGKSPQEPSGALPGSPPPGPRPEGGPPSGPPGAAGGSRNLMDLDKDGDGKISRQEAPERMQEFFDRIDANQDGFLDQGEIGQMRNRARRGGPPGAEGGPPPGAAPR